MQVVDLYSKPKLDVFPASQSVQATAPASEYFPPIQSPQNVVWGKGKMGLGVKLFQRVYFPAAQSVQFTALVGEDFPAGQSVQLTAPVGEVHPLGQDWQ